MFDGIVNAIHRELHEMTKKYENGGQMTKADLEVIDTMSHALKCLATCEAMEGESGYGGDSYARGRSRTTGRYMSRDGGYSQDEYRRY